jgi:hypothetical protein
MPDTYRIAVLPGDGIGKQVMPEGFGNSYCRSGRFLTKISTTAPASFYLAYKAH